MGVNVGLFQTNAHRDRAVMSADEVRTEQRDEFFEKMSAGIAIVIPIKRVIEIITDSAKLKELREAFVKQKMATSDFVKTSAKSSANPFEKPPDLVPPAKDNPSHREDFTSLLSTAAKTKPQAD